LAGENRSLRKNKAEPIDFVTAGRKRSRRGQKEVKTSSWKCCDDEEGGFFEVKKRPGKLQEKQNFFSNFAKIKMAEQKRN
jgi:hypothetical protein